MCTCLKLNHFAFRTLLKEYREKYSLSELFCNSLTIRFILRIIQRHILYFLNSIYLWNFGKYKWCGQFHLFSGIWLLWIYSFQLVIRWWYTIEKPTDWNIKYRNISITLLAYPIAYPYKDKEYTFPFLPKKPRNVPVNLWQKQSVGE